MTSGARLTSKRAGEVEWQTAWRRARLSPDLGAAERLVEEAARRIPRDEPVVYGWSGGKDSLALQVVMDRVEGAQPVLVTSHPALEFADFLAWALSHAPEGLRVERRDDVNVEWLQARPEMLFPATSTLAAKWFAVVQHAGQRQVMKDTGAGVLVLGRRTADGNFVGPVQPGGARAYRDRGGFLRLSPIADWTHEDLLNVLAAFDVDLPGIYEGPRGFAAGTGPWAARRARSVAEGWAEMLLIDPEIVEFGATHNLPGAAEALT